MSEFKKCNLVILRSKTPTHFAKDSQGKIFMPYMGRLNDTCSYQHFYITSSDEIKLGDWILNERRYLRVQKVENRICQDRRANGWRKILASTDKSLNLPDIDPVLISKDINYDGRYEHSDILVKYAKQEKLLNEKWNEYLIIQNGQIVDKVGIDEKYELKEYVVSLLDGNICAKLIQVNYPTESLLIEAIKDCLKYCEDQSVYDKLSKYGDFYYKLNQFIKENNL